MARGVNKTILIGNVGADPEYRVTPSGDGVVNFTLATSESWKDKQTQEIQQRTEWHKLTAFKEKAIVNLFRKAGYSIPITGEDKWPEA